ncbi:hypothetical protein HIN55_24115, partial [Salmonella enterica subsp. enterica serovar Typhimurium]|nr:hypothetical protein [Salmonella enterica subsp. enterica serovar Typhimurium]
MVFFQRIHQTTHHFHCGDLFRSLESATAFCKLRSNPWVELTHWLHQLTQQPDNDILHVLRH